MAARGESDDHVHRYFFLMQMSFFRVDRNDRVCIWFCISTVSNLLTPFGTESVHPDALIQEWLGVAKFSVATCSLISVREGYVTAENRTNGTPSDLPGSHSVHFFPLRDAHLFCATLVFSARTHTRC